MTKVFLKSASDPSQHALLAETDRDYRRGSSVVGTAE